MNFLREAVFIFLTIFSAVSFSAYEVEDCGSVNGISIPCWRTYLRRNEGDESLPFYPYAKRPNGCSLLNQMPGKSDEFTIKKDTYNFKEACNTHDRCYYTLNSDQHECNQSLLANMNMACTQSGSVDTRIWCFDRAKVFYDAVESFSPIVHRYSQFLENSYLSRVEKYLSTMKHE